MLGRIADLTWRWPKLVLTAVGMVAALAAVVGHDVEDHLQAAGFTDPASESEQATGVLRDALGFDATPGVVVLVRMPGDALVDLQDPTVRREAERLREVVERAPNIGQAVDPSMDPRLVAPDGRSFVVLGHLSTQDIEADGGDTAEAVKDGIRGSPLEVSVGGFAASFDEVENQTRKDLTNAELIAFPALAVLLLLVFRGVVAAAIPLLIGVLSILGTFLVLRIMSSLVDTSLFALNIATALSLGLAVDYALLLVSRYREELERHGPTREAHRRTVLTAGRTALFSGLTVAAAMASLIVLPQRFMYSIGAAGATVGVLSAVLALLVVPSLLRLAGSRINALSVRRGPSVADASGGWYRTAWGVMRRPKTVAFGSAALLLAAAAPLGWATLTGPSAEAVPSGQPSYAANHYVEDHYGRGVTEPVIVTIRGPAGDLGEFRDALAAVPTVARADAFTRLGDIAVGTVALEREALSTDSQDAVRAIRDLDPPGREMLVSGNTARFIDQKQSLLDHLPIVVLMVGGLTALLLFLLTGSIVLPLKTLLMNLLTLGATLGVLVLAFQVGLLSTPLDYTGPEAIEVTSLVFMFAIMFGLATDYAVLVMARIREHHDAGMSNEEAVATAMSRTGRVISAAAGLIAIVFLAFAVSPVFFMKQIAFGMAVGVVLDATVVRALLVPALMRLLGRYNWWAPAPLRRLHSRINLRESEPALVDVRGSLRGSARMPDGSPAARAVAVLTTFSGDVVRSVFTGADGTFAFDDVPEGPYTLTVSHLPARRDVDLVAGTSETADLVLP